MRLRWVTVGATLALAVLATARGSSGGGGGGGDGGESIKIGVPVPLSGQYATAGQDILNGAKLAAKKINDSGGVDGKKIELVSQDDACQAQTAAQAAQKLISQGVVAVAGGYCSTAAFPELQAFHRAGIPYVMDASTNPELTEKGWPEAFRTIGRDDEQGPFVAKFLTGFLKAERVAILHDNTTYAKGLAENTRDAIKEQGGAQVVFFNALTPGQSDYSSVLTKVAQSKPDVLYYTGYFAEFGLLLKQAESLGLDFQMMGGDATNDPTVIETAGDAANGAIVDTAPLAQFLSSAKDYVTAYQSAYGKAPGPYSVYEYDSVGVVAEAVKAAGSTDAKKITQALADMESYEGITGSFHFNDKGDREPVNYITLQVKDGEFTAYKKYDESGAQWVDAG